MKPKTLLTVAVILMFVAFLAYSTLSAQKVTCDVCVEFNGRTNCAPASAKDEIEATRTAQNTACGPISSGMNETIACGNRQPVSRTCRAK